MTNIQLNLSSIIQALLGALLIAATLGLWNTIADLNRAVWKLESAVQLSNAVITVLDKKINKMEIEIENLKHMQGQKNGKI